MNTQPVIGISGCLTGSAVRFDGGHKRMGFVMDELAQWVAFKPVCPEMAIGLPVPRPALRLVQTPVGEIRMRFSHAPHEDVTEKMADFANAHLGVVSENGIYGHSRFCNTDFDDKLACLNLSGV